VTEHLLDLDAPVRHGREQLREERGHAVRPPDVEVERVEADDDVVGPEPARVREVALVEQATEDRAGPVLDRGGVGGGAHGGRA
jgi:hypothetical protein